MSERDVYHTPPTRVLLRTEDVYQTEVADDVATYSDTLLSIVADFKNSGIPEGANAQAMVGKSKRGEVACRVFARIDPGTGIIEAAGFKARGCLAMTGCASAVCTLIEHKGIEEALSVAQGDISAFVDGVPADKVHALSFAECAVRALVGDFLLRDGASLQELDEAVPCDEDSLSCIMAEHCSLRQSRLDKRMEEREAENERIQTEACACVMDLVRERSLKGTLTCSDDWASLVPAHLMTAEFDAVVFKALDEGADRIGASELLSQKREQAPSLEPSPFANRGVGVPKIFGREDDVEKGQPTMPPTKRAIPKPEPPDLEDDELIVPEGYELVEVNGQWGLVRTDACAKRSERSPEVDGICVIQGGSTEYLYDSKVMKPEFARLAYLSAEDDPHATFAFCVREDSRIYPRPMAESSFANDPLNMDAEMVDHVWSEVRGRSGFEDIACIQASNGDVYYYSSRYLSSDLAQSLAEWESVERLWNV